MKNDLKKYCVVPLLILLLSACGSGSDTEQSTDTKPPEDTDPVAVVAPSIQPVDSPTRTSTQTLSGEKIANSAIWINDVERVPLDASTTWTVSDVLLNEGKNIFSIYAKNMAGDKSAELSLTILLDTTPPAKPTVTSPLSTTTSDYRLTGNKDANSSIFYNGVEVIPVNSNTTWLYDITLDTGENVISLTSRDVVGNESAIESTTITYSIPSGGVVNLTVMNAIGEEIESLVNEYKTEGTHNVVFNAENIPSGIYFYKLESAAFSSVKKMVLLK